MRAVEATRCVAQKKRCLRRGGTRRSASSLKRACSAEFGRVVCRDIISPSSPCMLALITNRTPNLRPGHCKIQVGLRITVHFLRVCEA